MAWFRRSTQHRSYAVVTPVAGGVAGLRLDVNKEGPAVAAYIRRQEAKIGADALERMAQDIGARHAPLIALLDTERYQTVLVESPPVPDEELLGAVRWKVKDLINFHIDDAVLDHLPVPAGAGRTPSLYVVAAKSIAVRELAAPFHDAGLPLEVIEVRESAQNRIAARLAPSDYAVALLHMEDDSGLLTFTYGEDLILSRRIEGRGATDDLLHERVAMDVQRSVDYFERQHSWFPLAKLYLAPMPEAGALQRKLKEFLPVGVENIDLGTLFDLSAIPELQSPERQNQAFHLVGAALREHP